MCGESWLAIKDLYITIPVLKAGHPGVLCFVCRYVYVEKGGGDVYVTGLGSFLPLFRSFASVLHTCISCTYTTIKPYCFTL